MSGIWRPSYFHSGYHCCPKRMKEEEKTAKQPKRRRKEDDTTIVSSDQSRVETPENCPLVSRTSFAARSRRTLRRIFPDGLKKGDRNIRLKFANKNKNKNTTACIADLLGISGTTITPPRRYLGFPTRGLIHSWTSFATRR